MTIIFKPENWVPIPGGSVPLELAGFGCPPTMQPVAAFAISRYPVTNAQFAPFVEAGGYMNPRWWDANGGWQKRELQGWDAPRYWGGRDWTGADQPVVGVSWYEAAAFCRWASAVTGTAIHLPTEAQWQRAAQGDDTREFPWGDADPDATRCNWQRDVDDTTPVMAYPAGVSPFGVWDMAGNVWEWTRSVWDAGERNGAAYLLRGGSWSSDSPFSLRAANRSASDPNTHQPPHTRDCLYGFRVVREG
jgi:formylglycine-generating enzyme required for sulfatase activity